MSENCPRCGARAELEKESWRRGDRAAERTFACASCGHTFSSRAMPPGVTDEPRRDRCLAWVALWFVLALVILWFLLRSMDYVKRAAFYHAASVAGEAFLHPAWLVFLLVAAALCLFLLRRGRTAKRVATEALAPDVQLRTEPPGKLTVIVSGSRLAMARDFVLDRDSEMEASLADEFDAISRRNSAFERRGSGGWRRSEIEEAQRELYSLGLRIGDRLLKPESGAADAIVDLPGDHLQLSLQPSLSRVPWELLVAREGGAYLWQLFSVSRQLRDVDGPPPRRRVRSGPARMLLLANPDADGDHSGLPHVEREATELLELAASRPEILRVIRKSPMGDDELARLLMDDFDIVHFAGHTDSGGWVLRGGQAVRPAELLRELPAAPGLVFANACRSNPGQPDRTTLDAAGELMRQGVTSYLCTLSELNDGGSAAFSATFYRALTGGATLASALTKARASLMGIHPVTWANYVLYGDPIARLDSL